MAMNTGTQFTDSTDGRQRLAGAMTGTNPYATGGTAGGNMSNMMQYLPAGTDTRSMVAGMGGSNGNMSMGSSSGADVVGFGGGINSPGAGFPTGGSGGNMSMGSSSGAGAVGVGVDPNTGAGFGTGAAGSGTGSSANQPAQAGGYNPDGSFNPDLPPVNSAAMSTQNSANRFSNVGDINSYGGAMDPATMRAGADAAYGAASQFFDPDFQRQRSTLENQLAAQGFTRGSEGYNNALDDMQRQQNLARTNAGLQAQGIGFGQANSLIQNALQTRAQDVAMRGQDRGVDAAGQSASATIGAANIGANAGNYRADLESELGLRGLGLQQDNQDYNQMMGLMGGARAGVNAPNFGQAAPLDVGSAYGVASGNANAAANRAASDRNGLYQLGGSLLGSAINGYFGN